MMMLNTDMQYAHCTTSASFIKYGSCFTTHQTHPDLARSSHVRMVWGHQTILHVSSIPNCKSIDEKELQCQPANRS